MKCVIKCLRVTLVLLALNAGIVKAHDFSALNSDGDTIYYRITSSVVPRTVEVACKGVDPKSYNEYRGDINIPDIVYDFGRRAYKVTSIGTFAFADCNALSSVSMSDSVTYIGKYAFRDCVAMTAVTLGNSVTKIDEGAFISCSALSSINIPNSVTTIELATFTECRNLKSVTIGNSVRSIGNSAFTNCVNLVSVDIPNSVTSIGSSAFDGCSNLTAINVNPDNQNYCSVDGLLYNITKSTLIRCPLTKTSVSIPSTVTTIGRYSFKSCGSLTSLLIPNSVTTIANEAFKNCQNLKEIVIPNSVTLIESSAFENCSGLRSVNLSNNITQISSSTFMLCSSLKTLVIPNSVKYIGVLAFSVCTALETLYLADSVLMIGESALYGCNSLNTVVCNAVTPPQIGENTFFNTGTNTVFYVPCESQANYRSHEYWGGLNYGECITQTTNIPEDVNPNIYPNPASDYIIIDNKQNITDRIYLYDISGRNVAEKPTLDAVGNQDSLVNGKQRITISALPKGMYFLRIGKFVEKFVKE